MKTLKIALIATIVSLACVSYAGNQPVQQTKVIHISLSDAMLNPALVKAMYFQLSTDFLKVEHQGLYTACVKFDRYVYKIYGTRYSWLRFFHLKPIWSMEPPEESVR